jgi:hypothetical protein
MTNELLGIFALARQLTTWGVQMAELLNGQGIIDEADMRRIRRAAAVSDRDFDLAVRAAQARLGREPVQPVTPPAPVDLEADVDEGPES